MRIKWILQHDLFEMTGAKSEESTVQINGGGRLIRNQRSASVYLRVFQKESGWAWKVFAINWITSDTISRNNSNPQTKKKAKEDAEKAVFDIALELENLTQNESKLRKKQESKKVEVSIEELKKIVNPSSKKCRPLKATA